jgi:hypothetical protein
MAGQPSLAALRGGVSPILSAQLAGLVNDPNRHIAQRVIPARNGVEKGALESGTIITSSGLFGDGSTALKRAVGASNNRNPGEALGTVTYTSEEYNLSDEIDGRKIDGALIDYLGLTVEDIAARLLIQREVDTDALLTTAANWPTNSLSALPAWTDDAADGIANIDVMVSSIGKFGRDANTLYFSKAGFDALRRNVGYRNYLPTTDNRNSVSASAMVGFLASEFDIPVKRIFVQKTARNTANAGQTKSVNYLNPTSRFCWVGYIDIDGDVIAGKEGLTLRPSAAARVMTKAPEFRNEAITRPFVGQFVLSYWREALTQVNEQLGGLITA